MSQRTVTCPWCGGQVDVAADGDIEQTQGPAMPPGTRVMSRWSNGTWYPGAVDEVRGDLHHVTFDDGEKQWAEREAVTTEHDPPDPNTAAWRPGLAVRAKWMDGRWYPGEIDQRFGRVWHVAFDDGDQAWLAPDRIRPTEQVSGAGLRVMGQWSDGKWYPGVIDQERHGLVHVAFDDGDTMWAEPHAVSRETDPPDDQGGRLQAGSRVTAQWNDGRWYSGKLDQRFGRIWHVRYDDGERAWLPASKIQPA